MTMINNTQDPFAGLILDEEEQLLETALENGPPRGSGRLPAHHRRDVGHRARPLRARPALRAIVGR